MSVSIIIVSYNARADLEQCLASLQDAPPQTAHDITVVDNASSDGSADAARRRRGVTVIALPANRGFAAANNAGIRATSGDNVLLLNSDTVVPPGAVDRLLAVLDAHPEVAVVGPRLVDAERRPELSFGPMMSPLAELRQQRLMRGYERREAAALARIDAMTRVEQRPDWVTGACLLIRRTDLEAVGLLDERFFMYTEDIDLCAAIRRRGRGVLFTPAVEVMHRRGRSAASAPAATRAAYRRSHLAFYRKHHPWAVPVLWVYHALRG